MLSTLCHKLSVSCSLMSPAVKSQGSMLATAALRTSTLSLSTRTQAEPQEVVSVLRLNMLQDNPGAIKKKRRVGRGIGSSKGKTCGRGHKGQKARAGGGIPHGFEGGQTKLYKLFPKRGFNNKRHAEPMVSINVGTIQDHIDMGRLVVSPPPSDDSEETTTTTKVLTMKDLIDAGICTKSSVKHGMKLLAKGKERLTTPFRLHISRASEAAIQAVEEVGGQVTTVHYNRLALRALLSPEKFARLPKFARPPPKWQGYYSDWDRNRGYLSVEAQMRDLLQQHRPDLQEEFSKALEKRLLMKDGTQEKEETSSKTD